MASDDEEEEETTNQQANIFADRLCYVSNTDQDFERCPLIKGLIPTLCDTVTSGKKRQQHSLVLVQ